VLALDFYRLSALFSFLEADETRRKAVIIALPLLSSLVVSCRISNSNPTQQRTNMTREIDRGRRFGGAGNPNQHHIGLFQPFNVLAVIMHHRVVQGVDALEIFRIQHMLRADPPGRDHQPGDDRCLARWAGLWYWSAWFQIKFLLVVVLSVMHGFSARSVGASDEHRAFIPRPALATVNHEECFRNLKMLANPPR
jgi:hypothetical protein